MKSRRARRGSATKAPNVILKQNKAISFRDFNINSFEKALQKENATYWHEEGTKKALEIFHEAAVRVPAYKHFLKKNHIQHEKIKTIGDFAKLPPTDKKNYISVYPIDERCFDGDLTSAKIIATSSGTKGEPVFWPRSEYQEFEASITHELIYRYLFEAEKYSTLLVICFPMGVYISGIATVLPSWLISKNYRMTCITPGNNKTEALRMIGHLEKNYEQIILVGHPFFIKDLIETGTQEGIRWNKKRLRMLFSSGGFNETWRKYMMELVGSKKNFDSIISTYGSSEMLLVAHETPLSIFVRNMMEEHTSFKNSLIQTEMIPNLFQYNPLLRYVETVNNELLFTSLSGLPLIRFNMHDAGEVVSYDRVNQALEKYIPHWKNAFAKVSNFQGSWRLPFVSLYGRSDYTVKFYAANIYPEHIGMALNHSSFLGKLTGKFTMTKGYKSNMDEYLEIHIELRPTISPHTNLRNKIQSDIIKKLRQVNHEYLDASTKLSGKDLKPKIILWPYQHDKYFKVGLKPRFITK